MKFKSFSAHILALLGLSEWSKVEDKNSITVEEVAKLKNYGFTEKFLTDFKASLENDFSSKLFFRRKIKLLTCDCISWLILPLRI